MLAVALVCSGYALNSAVTEYVAWRRIRRLQRNMDKRR
jgi:hypothetical protein